jgi:hypothetical protein
MAGKQHPRFNENRPRWNMDRRRAVSSRLGLRWGTPQQVVPGHVEGPSPARTEWPSKPSAERSFPVKPLWTVLCEQKGEMTFSQVDLFFKLILFFSNIPLHFGKTWFISCSLFLLEFSRCSVYNHSLERVKKFWDLTFQTN